MIVKNVFPLFDILLEICNNSAVTQNISRMFWNPKVCYQVYKNS